MPVLLKDAATREPYPALEVRRDRLRRAADVLRKNQERIVASVNADFGGQPEALTLMIDVLALIRSLKFASKHLKS